MTCSSRVVRLPTAARRQVKQPCNKGGRLARKTLREATAWPGQYVFPSMRDAARRLREFRALSPTSATILIGGILDAATMQDRRLLLDLMKMGATGGDPLAIQAQALFDQLVGTTFGNQNDFVRVLAVDPFVLGSFHV